MNDRDMNLEPELNETEEVIDTVEDNIDPTDEWRTALELAVKQRDEYLQLAQRGAAEFANFKKRTEQTRTEAYDDGLREVIAQMLPTIDNFERAIAAAKQSGDDTSLLEGVEMTQKIMLDALKKLGLEEVEAEGKPFDPELHNAVMKAEGSEPGMIMEVFQKGYLVRGKIIRYPMVKVAAD